MIPGLVQLVAPAVEPVSLADMKAWLRVDIPDDDQLIGQLITDARTYVENKSKRQLITAQWQYTGDSFPPYDMSIWLVRQPRPYLPQTRQFQGSGGGTIKLPKPPLVSVQSITYVEPSAGATLTLDPTTYLVDTTTEPGRISPAYGQVWPVTRWQVNAIQINYTCGYGSASQVPANFRRAIMLLVASWYENREAVSAIAMNPVPRSVDDLIIQGWYGEYT